MVDGHILFSKVCGDGKIGIQACLIQQPVNMTEKGACVAMLQQAY